VYNVLRSSGQPLDTQTRAFFEQRFGHDFSRVRVHTDAEAAESARAVNALAYTVGYDIVLAQPAAFLGTTESTQLVAHELTHVVQQSGASDDRASLQLGSTDSSSEREADWVARAMITKTSSAESMRETLSDPTTVASRQPEHLAIRGQSFTGSTQVQEASVQRQPAKTQTPVPPPGPDKWPDEKDSWYQYYQLSLQGVTGLQKLSAQQKAERAGQIADFCMLRQHIQGKERQCAKDAANDQPSKMNLEVGLSQWIVLFKSALQTTAGSDDKSPKKPVDQATDIADQALKSTGMLDPPLWDIYMRCKQQREQLSGGRHSKKTMRSGH